MTEITIPNFDIALTADSGQCFRFNRTGERDYQLIAHGRVLTVRDLGEGRYLLGCEQGEFEALWRHYFDLETDYAAILSGLPADDAFLQVAARYAGGLRILRQDPWETLIGFIISQRKNLASIKSCMAAISRRFGTPIPGTDAYAFPTPGQLAAATLEELNACALGYRSRYIQQTARLIADGALDLAALDGLPDAAMRAALVTLPGVGVKIADCVMLFGYHRTRAFPHDVWINRVVEREYGGQTPAENLGPYAGVIQQYMFCYARGPAYRPAADASQTNARPDSGNPLA